MRAKPRAKIPGVTQVGDMLVVAVREPAVDGRANAAIVRAVAAFLGLAPSAIVLRSGAGSRTKLLEIED